MAAPLGVAGSTVARWLARHGLGQLARLDPPEPMRRDQRERPGALIHLDMQTLMRESACGLEYPTSNARNADMPGWLDRFNRSRPHAPLKGQTPMQRVNGIMGNHGQTVGKCPAPVFCEIVLDPRGKPADRRKSARQEQVRAVRDRPLHAFQAAFGAFGLRDPH
ncbi:MAG: hypothetical protein Kow0013_21800 [Pararhodobacter sp.]